jgi:hypothetical protein
LSPLKYLLRVISYSFENGSIKKEIKLVFFIKRNIFNSIKRNRSVFMKYLIPVISALILLIFLSSCPFNGPDPSYTVTMYVSLGLYGAYPPDPYDGSSIEGLSNYGGKTVVFSVEGINDSLNPADNGAVNDSINKLGTAVFGWTGGDPSSSTQYATFAMDLAENTMYLQGSYKFRMFIDWDNSSSLSSGDLVFGSYSILADKDDDPETGNLPVLEEEYGTAISYNPGDFSLTIEDPLSGDDGLAWVITDIHEGTFEVY